MTSEIYIRRGYQVVVTSYENDGDNYKTKTVVADTEQDALVLVALAKLLRDEFGNLYEPNDFEREQFAQAVANIPGMKEYVYKHCPDLMNPEYGASEMDFVMDILYEMSLSAGDYFTRACTDVEVYYVPENVYAERIV